MPKDATDIGVFYSIDGKNWSQADFPLVEQYERIEFNPTSIKNEDGHTLCEEVPIIVKLIDAERDLSVQVHPPTEDESLMPGINGKSELWHVVDCKPGAFVYCGFNRGIAKF